MAEDDPSFNDNLLDQEIESENLPGGDDMDIDLAIENALDDLDGELSLDDVESAEPAAITDDEIGSLESLLEDDNQGPASETSFDAGEDVGDFADLSFDEDEPLALDDDSDIPVINDVFDPKKKAAKQPPVQAAVSDKDLLKQILALIDEVVEKSVQSEVEKISASLKHQVNKDVKARLGELLKGK